MAKIVIFLVVMIYGVICKPLENENIVEPAAPVEEHRLQKRFIDMSQTFGSFSSGPGISRIRTKRSLEDDCEKLELCKLHARSDKNLIAAFELYFVNKDEAKLWDHASRSMSDCYKRFSECLKK